jgi:hypothetical protein
VTVTTTVRRRGGTRHSRWLRGFQVARTGFLLIVPAPYCRDAWGLVLL